MLRLGLPTLLAIAVVFFGGFSTSTAHGQTITDIVLQSGGEFDENRGDFDILLTAVVTANLAGALADPAAELTVFAPNDRAFVRLARDLGYPGFDEEGAWNAIESALLDLSGGDPTNPALTNVLLYHVAPGSISPLGIILRSIFSINIDTLLTGATITPAFFTLVDNDPDAANPRLRFPLNIMATNGRIHTINRVLRPLDLP